MNPPAGIESQAALQDVTRWWQLAEENYGWRNFIEVNGRLARRGEGEFGIGPIWDPEMKLLVWTEGIPDAHAHYMDSEGRYRAWRKGRYCGKIPKE